MLTRDQLDLIPDPLLHASHKGGCSQLIEWLYVRGWRMTLLELESERARRGGGPIAVSGPDPFPPDSGKLVSPRHFSPPMGPS